MSLCICKVSPVYDIPSNRSLHMLGGIITIMIMTAPINTIIVNVSISSIKLRTGRLLLTESPLSQYMFGVEDEQS